MLRLTLRSRQRLRQRLWLGQRLGLGLGLGLGLRLGLSPQRPRRRAQMSQGGTCLTALITLDATKQRGGKGRQGKGKGQGRGRATGKGKGEDRWKANERAKEWQMKEWPCPAPFLVYGPARSAGEC